MFKRDFFGQTRPVVIDEEICFQTEGLRTIIKIFVLFRMSMTDLEGTPRKIPRTVVKIEEEYDLWDREIEGVNYWERVRSRIGTYVKLSENYNEQSFLDIISGFRGSIRRVWLLLKNIFVKNPFLEDEADILFLGQRRREVEGDKVEDIYCDPIAGNIDRTYLMAEPLHNERHFEPLEERNICYTELINYMADFLVKLGIFSVSIDEEEKEILSKVENTFQEKTGLELNLARIVSNNLGRRKAEVILYDKFISRIKPEIVIVANTGMGKESLIEVCKEQNIPVAEFQHGTIHEYSLNYSFPGNRTKQNFPDYFLVWGDYWKDTVSFPIKDENIFSVGFPYYERETAKYEEVDQKENQILFVSQPVIADELAQFALEFSEATDKYDIIYKIHPEVEDWEEKHPELADSDLTVRKDEIPLYKLFAESSAQIGVFSTTLFEAISFDISTYIVDLEGSSIMKDLITSGHAELVETPGELSEELSNQRDIEADGDQFFRRDALETTIKKINQIIEKHQKQMGGN